MDTSPTALFDSYEQDFQQIISSIRDKLEGDAKSDAAGLCAVLCWFLTVGLTGMPRAKEGRIEEGRDGT